MTLAAPGQDGKAEKGAVYRSLFVLPEIVALILNFA